MSQYPEITPDSCGAPQQPEENIEQPDTRELVDNSTVEERQVDVFEHQQVHDALDVEVPDAPNVPGVDVPDVSDLPGVSGVERQRVVAVWGSVTGRLDGGWWFAAGMLVGFIGVQRFFSRKDGSRLAGVLAPSNHPAGGFPFR